jgi:hypothetical protein
MVSWKEVRGTQLLLDAFDGKDAVALQYTSIDDENGKEIYGGDIINTKANRYIIYYVNPIAAFIAEALFYDDKGKIFPFHCLDGSGIAKNGFVLGNLFENPELANINPATGVPPTKSVAELINKLENKNEQANIIALQAS